VGIRHYAPRARLVLVDAPLEEIGMRLAQIALGMHGERIGVMLPEGVDVAGGLAECRMVVWGAWSRPEEMARDLYAGLRMLDRQGCTVILCPLPAAEGIGAAIRDRLKKAGT
jgi:L-threonylcarbamoyladenylate synthase